MICLSQNETGRETDMRLLFAEDERSLSRAVTAILSDPDRAAEKLRKAREIIDRAAAAALRKTFFAD